jgi:hypothetical protein
MDLEQLEEVMEDLQQLDATEDGREALAAVQMSVTGG